MTARLAMRTTAVMSLIVLMAPAVYAADAQRGAPLQEIGQAGPAVPVAPYLAHLLSGQDQPGVLPGVQFPLTSRLKVDTSRAALKADKGHAASVLPAQWVAQPMFVLGADASSRAWLQTHRAQLVAMGAAGIVVAAASERDFKALQSLTPELTLVPVTGPWLEQTLIEAGIQHYPLWIDGQGRVQSTPTRSAP